ncbi:UUP1 family membrane protein [Lentisphaerota bacterium ZTH]|nr:UUP1 family membrane protein [Lentisphaerota bacterium]WET06760.1 UUP1 family membrane protein [Lentisphaerota bacterium ZTH]
MKQPFSIKLQLYLIFAVLCAVTAAMIYYKVKYMGFRFKPQVKTELWQIEARISFYGQNQPVTVKMTTPDNPPGYSIQSELSPVRRYKFTTEEEDGIRRAVWTCPKVTGIQRLYYMVKVFKSSQGTTGFDVTDNEPTPLPQLPLWKDTAAVAVKQIIKKARGKDTTDEEFVSNVIRMLNEPKNPQVNALLIKPVGDDTKYDLFSKLMAKEKYPTRKIQGVFLRQGAKWQNPNLLAEVYYDKSWHIFNLETGAAGLPGNFLVFRRGGISLFDVIGARNSKIRFSVTKSVISANKLYPARAKKAGGGLWLYFSVYSLPAAEQNAFKKLVMIPLGILIIVLLRNVVGINTMGTFMPVLLTLAFMETKLVPGLLLFSVILIVGLSIRFYLSRLNLLLTPRISSVVILVIILMMAVSVISFHAGLHEGLTVTFFPLIIIAWTIERSSIIWEEDGPVTALKQLGASVGAGVLCYLAMGDFYVQHIMYSFMELNLVVMGIILLLGTYTGYRLTELHRFASLVKK